MSNESKNENSHRVAIIGSGPSGLMAAWVLAKNGFSVVVFEKEKSPARKLLIAGSSGLNVTYEDKPSHFYTHYRCKTDLIKKNLAVFSPQDWLEFIHNLGIKTFLGTSRRHFVEGLKASKLLRNWLKALQKMGVSFKYGHELANFKNQKAGIEILFKNDRKELFDVVILALGGGSYVSGNLDWPEIFNKKGIQFNKFTPSNVGYEVSWPAAFLNEANRLPLKNIKLTTPLGEMNGDVLITEYGLEGTPIYSLAQTGVVHLDLKPDLTSAQIVKKISTTKENLSPLRRVKKFLNLSSAALALVFHLTNDDQKADLLKLTALIKKFPITLKNPRPLAEAISSAGGVSLDEIDASLMLKKCPGVFVAGEMLDWDAPTGGFLIQACVSQGFVVGSSVTLSISKPLKKSLRKP